MLLSKNCTKLKKLKEESNRKHKACKINWILPTDWLEVLQMKTKDGERMFRPTN